MAFFRIHLGWYAVLCLLFDRMIWTGLLKGLGFMLPMFKEQFTIQTWLVGWIIAMITGVINLAGIFAAPLGSLFGTRAVVMWSGVMVGGSLILVFFASSIAQITIILAFGFGTGISLTDILTRVVIAQYFESNYATANGIGQTGSPLGLIVVAPLVQLCLDTYGWRSAFLLLGGMSVHLVACGALLRQPLIGNRDYYEPVSSNDEHKKSRKNAMKDNLMAVRNQFGISVCLQLSFWFATIVFICNMLADTFWCIYYVDHIIIKGFTANDAVVFTTAAGFGNLISKVFTGVLIDKDVLKVRPALAILLTASMVCLMSDPWMNSFSLALVNVFIFIGCKGAVSSLTDVYTRELVGTELIASAFSWMQLVNGIITLCTGFVPGLIHDMTGNYDAAFLIMGCLYVPPLVALSLDSIRQNQES